MGLRTRQRSKPVTLAVINTHNLHLKLTWADTVLAWPRKVEAAKREVADAEWEERVGWRVKNMTKGREA